MTGPAMLSTSRLLHAAQSSHQRRLLPGSGALTTVFSTLFATFFALLFHRRLRCLLRGLILRLVTWMMLFPIRLFVTVMTTYQKKLRLHAPQYVAQDGYSVLAGVDIALDSIRYGPHPSETMDVVQPKQSSPTSTTTPTSTASSSTSSPVSSDQQQQSKQNPYPIPSFSSFSANIATRKSGKDAPILIEGEYFESTDKANIHDGANAREAVAQCPIVYIHGGGFIMANSASLIHSITCFARQGFTVYSVDYPLAPENPFPKPLLSVIRAVWWLKNQNQVKSVILVGDSAGSNLAYMAAGLIANPDTFRAYKQHLVAHGLWDAKDDYLVPDAKTNSNNDSNTAWPYPKLSGVCSLYGYLMDLETWKTSVPSLSLFENTISTCLYHFASFAYRGYFSVGFRGQFPVHQSIPVSPAELIQTFRQNSNNQKVDLDLEPEHTSEGSVSKLAKLLPELSDSYEDLNLEVLDQTINKHRGHNLNKTTSWPSFEDGAQKVDNNSEVSTNMGHEEERNGGSESTKNLFCHFPRSLQVCGGKDTLVTSSKLFHGLLTEAGWDSSLCILPMARHAFFGFPTSWTFGGWKTTAYPVCPLLIEFLTSCAISSFSSHPPPIDTSSYSVSSSLLSPSLFSPSSSTSSAPMTPLLLLSSSPSPLNDRDIYYGNHNFKKKKINTSVKNANNNQRKQRPLTVGA